jgi:type VI secretion system protein ImpL
MDQKMEANLEKMTSKTSGDETMVYGEHLVARINLIKAHLDGKSIGSSEYAFKVLPRILGILDKKLLPEIAAKFGDIYFYYLKWGIDDITARSKMKELQTALVRLIEKEHSTLYWLVDWANSDPTIPDITLEDFWGPSDSEKSRKDVIVKRAFTVKGYEIVEEFIKYFEVALPGEKDISDKREKFVSWYRKKYFQMWKEFIGSFSDGQFNLDGADEWQSMTATMTTVHNPYSDIIERCTNELKPFADGKDVPVWVAQLIEIQSVIDDAARKRDVNKDKSVLTKVAHGSEKLVSKVVKEVKTIKNEDEEEKHVQAVTAFNNYIKDLGELLPVSTARSQAYKAASEFFPYSLKPSESKSPFFSAYGEIQKFKTYLKNGTENTEALRLLSGPLQFLIHYVSMETACSLQHDWEDIVLGSIQGVAPEKLPTLLFGQSGAVWKFVQGPAAPFLSRNQNGYSAKKTRGARIPFKNDFFTFITQGNEVSTSIQPEYKVMVKALPIDVNDGAQKEPYEVALELQCVKGKTRLENYNYPASQMFTWSPEDCDDVTLQIYLEGLTLTKKYSGHNGFPRFLSDFKSGGKSFTVDDFPESKGILQKMNISEIKVSYEFTDSKPVIQLLEKVPQKTPEVIATCWDR